MNTLSQVLGIRESRVKKSFSGREKTPSPMDFAALKAEWDSRITSIVTTLDGGGGFSTDGELLGCSVDTHSDIEYEPDFVDSPVWLTREDHQRIDAAKARRAAYPVLAAAALRTALSQAREGSPRRVSFLSADAFYGEGIEDFTLLDDGGRWDHEGDTYVAEQRLLESKSQISLAAAMDRRNPLEWELANERWDLFVDLARRIRTAPLSDVRKGWRRIKSTYRDAVLSRYFRGVDYKWDPNAGERGAYVAPKSGKHPARVLSATSPRLKLTGRQVAALEALAIDRSYAKCLCCERDGSECYRHQALSEARHTYKSRLEAAKEGNTRRAGLEHEASLLYSN